MRTRSLAAIAVTTAVAISDPTDVTADVGGDQATAWQVQTADVQGVVIAVRMQGIVVTFQFQAPAGVTTAPPLPVTVAKAGMDKIIAS